MFHYIAKFHRHFPQMLEKILSSVTRYCNMLPWLIVQMHRQNVIPWNHVVECWIKFIILFCTNIKLNRNVCVSHMQGNVLILLQGPT
jgi:hypothetical protein